MEEYNVIDDLVNMELHDEYVVNPATTCLRVVGGWLYVFQRFSSRGPAVSSVFVPYDDPNEKTGGRRLHTTV